MRKGKDDRGGVSFLLRPKGTPLSHVSVSDNSQFIFSYFYLLGLQNGASKKRFACLLNDAKLSSASSVFSSLYVENVVSFFAVCFEDILAAVYCLSFSSI